jgi:hypothetical protein
VVETSPHHEWCGTIFRALFLGLLFDANVLLETKTLVRRTPPIAYAAPFKVRYHA